ncbi:MAG: Clp protease N-terminal domain-containing protein [Actinomycetota bacterium]|nr:Clp protease N-terminal domain-containing protein [Actinomycetota bacterium]
MPKVNVYLPDELAAAVRAARVPISAVCQRALAEAVERVTTARRAADAMRRPDFDLARVPQLGTRLSEAMTPPLQEALRLGRGLAGSRRLIDAKDLLVGMLEEGGSFALGVLQALDVDREALREAALAVEPDEPAGAEWTRREPEPDDAGASDASTSAPDAGESEAIATLLAELGGSARAALASALDAAIDLGHNYVGTEHLLIGLARNANSGAGRLLGAFGIDASSATRAIGVALAGYRQGRRQEAANATTHAQLEAILARLERLEARLDTTAR